MIEHIIEIINERIGIVMGSKTESMATAISLAKEEATALLITKYGWEPLAAELQVNYILGELKII